MSGKGEERRCEEASALRVAHELAEERLEPLALARHAVLDRGRPRVEHAPLEEPRADELVEASRQRRRRNAPERLAELLGDGTRPPATHGLPRAPARARAPRSPSSPGGTSSRRARPAARPRDRD